MKEVVKKSKVKGLYYISFMAGSFRFLKIMHSKSKKLVISFAHHPVEKITDVIKISDKILSKANWDKPDSELIDKTHVDALKELRKKVVLNELGKYIVKP